MQNLCQWKNKLINIVFIGGVQSKPLGGHGFNSVNFSWESPTVCMMPLAERLQLGAVTKARQSALQDVTTCDVRSRTFIAGVSVRRLSIKAACYGSGFYGALHSFSFSTPHDICSWLSWSNVLGRVREVCARNISSRCCRGSTSSKIEFSSLWFEADNFLMQ